MTALARSAGLERAALYRAFADDSAPDVATVRRLLRALTAPPSPQEPVAP